MKLQLLMVPLALIAAGTPPGLRAEDKYLGETNPPVSDELLGDTSPSCPMTAEDTKIAIKELHNGVTITVTSPHPKIVKDIKELAAKAKERQDKKNEKARKDRETAKKNSGSQKNKKANTPPVNAPTN